MFLKDILNMDIFSTKSIVLIYILCYNLMDNRLDWGNLSW